jgi:hypothetical protein
MRGSGTILVMTRRTFTTTIDARQDSSDQEIILAIGVS